jgi:ribosomal protein S2
MLLIKNFLKYTIYIGHNESNSVVLSAWFFYKLIKKIWVINILKTVIFLKIVLKFLTHLIANRFPFWFINLELSKSYVFKKYAFYCGEFSCTKKWVRGFLSNFRSVQQGLSNYIFKKIALKSLTKKDLINKWNMTRFTWPRSVFLSSIPLNYVVCKEASDIALPVVSIVDTNVKSFLFTYPIPSNDDSLEGICYILNILSKHILLSKYKKLMLWYNKSSRKFNLINMFKRLHKIKFFKKTKFKRNKKKIKKIKIKNLRQFFLIKLFRNVKWRKFLISKLFDNFSKFKQNFKRLTLSSKIKFVNKNEYSYHFGYNAVLERKALFTRKLNYYKYFFRTFLKRFKFKISYKPSKVLSNPKILDSLRFVNRKKLNKVRDTYYVNYLLSSTLIKKILTFHDSFFINKPSRFVFGRLWHKNNWYFKKKYQHNNVNWSEYEGLRYTLDKEAYYKWVNNKFNSKFKNNNIARTKFVDAATVINLNRWLVFNRRRSFIFRKRRQILEYWLHPIYPKFFIKQDSKGFGFKKFWYQSRFYFKEDSTFKHTLIWPLSKYKLKTPLSSLTYYNSWFYSFLKNQSKYIRNVYNFKKFNRFRFRFYKKAKQNYKYK